MTQRVDTETYAAAKTASSSQTRQVTFYIGEKNRNPDTREAFGQDLQGDGFAVVRFIGVHWHSFLHWA